MALIPPTPVGVPPGHSFWNDWYEKLRTLVNTIETLAHNALTGLQGGTSNQYYHLTSAQHTETTATRSSRGVDTTDDIIIDLATKGLVLKDTQGTPHYWRLTVSNIGVLITTDLGTTKP